MLDKCVKFPRPLDLYTAIFIIRSLNELVCAQTQTNDIINFLKKERIPLRMLDLEADWPQKLQARKGILGSTPEVGFIGRRPWPAGY